MSIRSTAGRISRVRNPIAQLVVSAAVAALALVVIDQPAAAEPNRASFPETVDYFTDAPTALTNGADGNVWFVAGASIGRLTPAGEITSFRLDRRLQPSDLVADAGGIWFTAGRAIGHLTFGGELTMYSDGLTANPTAIDVGTDGRIWFAGDRGRVGLISATGQITEHVITTASGAAYTTIPDLAVGADGSAWMLAQRQEVGSFDYRSALVRVDDEGTVLARLPELTYASDTFGSFYGAVGRGPGGSVYYIRNSQSDEMSAIGGSVGRLTGNSSVGQWGGHAYGDLTIGPDGNLWFGLSQPPPEWAPEPGTFVPTVARLTAAGAYTNYDIGRFDQRWIAGGPGGRIWVNVWSGVRSVTASGVADQTFASPYQDPWPISAIAGDGGGRVSWTPRAEDADDITSYLVEVEPTGQRLEIEEPTIAISGLPNDSSYEVTVRAAGDDGVGLPTRTWLTPLGQRAYPSLVDFRGDARPDVAVFRPSNGTWYVQGQPSQRWGADGDIPVAADYTGDGKAELAVWRPGSGTWFVRGVRTRTWGQRGDVPVSADYTGDGKADLAVYRPSNGTWYVFGLSATHWGRAGDIPVPGNYVGDRRADPTVFRPETGTWHRRGAAAVEYGRAGDRPLSFDIDGNGRNELAILRPDPAACWVQGEGRVAIGTSYPVPGDFDGDGRAWIGSFNPWRGEWQMPPAGAKWGVNGDLPV